jgi:predicted DNA-binding protein with PD1-like motif
MEIVSLVGTLSSENGHHLHISVANRQGNVFGGQFNPNSEAKLLDSAEVALAECLNYEFKGEKDAESDEGEINVVPSNQI